MLAISNVTDSGFQTGSNSATESFVEKLYKSLEYLGFRAKNCNVVTACDTIEKIVSEHDKHTLFQQFFPDDWRKSPTSFFKTGYYENYSERTNQFFELVNDKLFPLLTGWNDDPEADLENFFICSLNLDLCCEEFDPDHLRLSYVFGLLFYIETDILWDYLTKRFNFVENDFPAINNRPHENLWRLEKNSVIWLYLSLFELVDHSTGNPWLDTVDCQGGSWFGWDAETIVELTLKFQEANKFLDRIGLLDDLIELRPAQTLLDLITLWNEAKLPEDNSAD